MIKMINGVKEVLILRFTAFTYEYLFLKYRRTRLNSEVIYSGEDLIWFDEKKKDGKPKISGSFTKKKYFERTV